MFHKDYDDDNPNEEASITGQASHEYHEDDNYCCMSKQVYVECGNKKRYCTYGVLA